MENSDLAPALSEFTTYAGSEDVLLVEMLDFYRAVLARKASGLTAGQLDAQLPFTDLTIGGLIYHMAMVEDIWFHTRFAGNDNGEPWASMDWEGDPDYELHNANALTPQELMAQYDESIARSRAVYAAADGLDQHSVVERDGTQWNLRWILIHMIEEYARHCGHADLIRQSIDGVTGD